jgi:hypothetical protein
LIVSVRIIQDGTMELSGSGNWEKRKNFLSEEDGTYMVWAAYFRPPDSSWGLNRESLYKGFFGGRVSRFDGAGFVHGG